MDLTIFLQQRRPEWRRLEAILRRVEGSGLRSLDDAQAIEFGRLYRRAASDLNQAQTFVSGETTVQYLNDLVARCYLAINARGKADPWGLLRYLVWEYPAVFRRHVGALLLATALFAAGTAFGFVAAWFDPAARAYLLPTDMPMIHPATEGEEDTTPLHTTGELAAFSSFLFTHNLTVSLVAFALGLTFGIGTAWLLFSNGLVLGALAAVFGEAGQFTALATGILPHGVLEIPACLLGGAAGFLLARALIRARPWPRLEELVRSGKEAMLLAAGCVPLLLAAAVLEAGVARAPDWFLGRGLKLAVAGVFGLVFVAYVLLLGWGNSGARIAPLVYVSRPLNSSGRET
jgi:uncharacterized membrane protein SpoIIM required for sporulation